MSYGLRNMAPPRSASRVDEWALIAQQKSIEQQQARQYQIQQADEKRRKLKEYLDNQVQEKLRKEEELKRQDQKYANEALRRVGAVEDIERQRKRETMMKRKMMESENKHLFSNVIDSKVNEQYSNLRSPNAYSMDIGYQAQLERRQRVQQDKRRMMDQLDRQIQEKERVKHELKQIEHHQDLRNLSYQYESINHRKSQNQHHHSQNPIVYQHYQKLLEKQHQKQRMFDYNQIDFQNRKKQAEEIRKAQQKDQIQRQRNQRMKEILDQQVIIQQKKKEQENKVNPEELTYGLLGNILRNRYNPTCSQSYKQQYSEQLRHQIEQRQRKKQSQRYMNEEQYKINLNQLNRVVDGKYADQTYIDRSIHALSNPKAVDVAKLNSKVQKPDVQAIKPKLEELIHRRQQRASSPPFDHNRSF